MKKQALNQASLPYVVSVYCMTFNHSKYIVEAMDGFCLQKTDFPFVCTIIDDASTDGEQDVINQYLQKHFDMSENSCVRNEETDDYILTFAQHKTNKNCFFAVVLLKYNHYQIKKPKLQYLSEWRDHVRYIAWCEGDDFWVDPMKLQKQVDYMELHPDCTMTCSRAKLYSEKQQKYIGESYCYSKSQFVFPEDIIRRGGLYINSCSIIYRKEIKDNYPDYCKKCAVGDYPLQIMCAMKGCVYYFNEAMAVYRVENSSSWRGQQDINKVTCKRFNTILSEVNMFKGFSKDYPNYSTVFHDKINHFICSNYPTRNKSHVIINSFLSLFEDDILRMSYFWKTILFLKKLNIPGVLTLFYPFTKKYIVLIDSK